MNPICTCYVWMVLGTIYTNWFWLCLMNEVFSRPLIGPPANHLVGLSTDLGHDAGGGKQCSGGILSPLIGCFWRPRPHSTNRYLSRIMETLTYLSNSLVLQLWSLRKTDSSTGCMWIYVCVIGMVLDLWIRGIHVSYEIWWPGFEWTWTQGTFKSTIFALFLSLCVSLYP